MTEEQLRDVLARVVPDPPDSVADPQPVVRAARTRRRAQVVGVISAAAVVAVVGVVGGRALVDDDASPQVAEEPSLAVDPYAAAPCPAELPKNGAFPADEVVAVRYCGHPVAGFPSTPGPPDALVDGVDSFVDAVTALPSADPARCALISMMPGDDRLLIELADGSSVAVAAEMCQDVDAGDRMLDGGEITQAFAASLDHQRDRFTYTTAEHPTPGCDETSTQPALAKPGREVIVAGTWCSETGPADPLDSEAVAALADGWRAAVVDNEGGGDGLSSCSIDSTLVPYLMARTDHGDLLRIDWCSEKDVIYSGWKKAYRVPVNTASLSES